MKHIKLNMTRVFDHAEAGPACAQGKAATELALTNIGALLVGIADMFMALITLSGILTAIQHPENPESE